MKQVFEAQNTVEAHMIQNMLLQINIHSHLQGEHLQGGVGELQASFVRVIVEDDDYLKAIAVIREWEDKQPKNSSKKIDKKKSIIFSFQLILGALIGASITSYMIMSPTSNEGIDFNNDGIVDHSNSYNGSLLSKSSIDRNFDGELDLIHQYNYQGLIKSSSADEDFNGSFETDITYEKGNIKSKHSDTTGDGYPDYQISYEHGVITQIMIIDSKTKQPVEIQRFDGFKMVESETF